MLRLDQLQIQQLWIDVGSDHVRLDAPTALEQQPAGAPVAYLDARDCIAAFDARAMCLRLEGDRLGDGAHAAARMSPQAAMAVDLAEGVMQQHVGTAGGV